MEIMRRRDFLKATAAVTMFGTGATAFARTGKPSQPAKQPKRPNVIVIYVDDLDNDELGVLGNKNLMTPNIDRLAREGVQFTNGYVTSSICTPSRYGILTGNYASRSVQLQTNPASSWRKRNYPAGGPGNIHFNAILSPGEKSVGNHLKDAGYTTGFVGKWHLSPGWGPEGKKVLIPKSVAADSPEEQALIRKFYNESCSYVKENYGFDYVDGFYETNPDALLSIGYPKKYGDHNPEWMTAKALEFIDKNTSSASSGQGDKPFFLYYALTLPHGEGNRLIKTIKDADPYLTPAGKLDKLSESGMPSRESIFERLKRARLPKVACGMLWVDDAVGSLLKKLDDCGLTEKTVIFFISDNGNYAKEALYDGGVRVPYFVKWPGVIKPSTKSNQIVANVDVVPTIMDIVGHQPQEKFDGLSILPLLKGEDKPVRDALLLEVGYGRAIVTKDWKYIALRFPDFEWPEIERQGGLKNVNYNASSASAGFRIAGMKYYPNHYYDFDQLYDRRKDAGEQKNLAKNPQYSQKVKEMRTLLRKALERMPHTFGEIRPE